MKPYVNFLFGFFPFVGTILNVLRIVWGATGNNLWTVVTNRDRYFYVDFFRLLVLFWIHYQMYGRYWEPTLNSCYKPWLLFLCGFFLFVSSILNVLLNQLYWALLGTFEQLQTELLFLGIIHDICSFVHESNLACILFRNILIIVIMPS